MLSFWEKNSLIEYDYIIIGSGIVGMSAAAEIKEKKPKASVLILEKGTFPQGASTKNAGFACFGSLTELLADLKTLSEAETVEIVHNRWSGLQALRKRLGDTNIDYISNGGYELISRQEAYSLDKIEQINTLLKPIFKKDVFTLENSKIHSFGFNSNSITNLVYNTFEGQIDTGKMIKSFISYLRSLDIAVLNGQEVTEFNDAGNFVSVVSNGIEFKAKKLTICTNAFTKKLLPEINLYPGRGQVILTKPIEDLKFKGVFHMDEGYFYFRNLGKRVLFGGGRHLDLKNETTTNFNTTEFILNTLKDKLDQTILPNQAYEIEHQWSGIMAFGENKTPLLKNVSKNISIGVRLGGMGLAIGSQLGATIAELMFEN